MSPRSAHMPVALLAITLILAASPGSAAQCILVNPSFEVPGSGGEVHAGWNQFGPVSSAGGATHGSVALGIAGPDLGGWDVAGVWQEFDTVPGERWVASVRGWHDSPRPLDGNSRAILNIEWRDSLGGLLGYESHNVADPTTPLGEIRDFAVTSQPAPPGAVAARLLLGVLQGPTDPRPDVYYDEATFFSAGPPTQDDIQWNDFPGGRTLSFAGRSWRVKGPGFYGPGPNLFADGGSNTWVDANGRLHLTIKQQGSSWYSTETVLEEALGYGDYVFTTYGRVDDLHANVVLGLFLWEYGPCYSSDNVWWNPYNEIDVEFSRWGNPAADVGQFVAQPYDWPGNISRFDAVFTEGELTSHAFEWLPDRVEYRSWRGGAQDESPGNMIHSWTYGGPHIPRPEQPRVHTNLWYSSSPPDGDQEVILDDFTFVPACLDSPCVAVGIPGDSPRSGPEALLAAAQPNPFGARTAISFRNPSPGHVLLVVYDVNGRRIRTLGDGFVGSGGQEVTWNGNADDGKPVASGVYFYQLRSGNRVETRRVVLIR